MLHYENFSHETYYHVNFSTRWLRPTLDREKVEWIEQIARRKGAEYNFKVLLVNGGREHIHFLLSVPPTLALDGVVKVIKNITARVIPDLAWQRRYYVKTVDRRSLETVYKYIKHRWLYRQREDLN